MVLPMPLADQLAVGVVPGAGQGVGDEGCEQAVDGTEQGEDQRRRQGAEQESDVEHRDAQIREGPWARLQ